MAPSSGHILVPKAIRLVRAAISKTKQLLQSRTAAGSSGLFGLSKQPVRVYAQNKPLHPLAILKQARSQQGRFFATHVRNFTSSVRNGERQTGFSRANLPVSKISQTFSQRGLRPFATTLRPNLTGGALPRTAGGYSSGGIGKARHFSHTSSCSAQVVQNVSTGVRAFFFQGGRVQYDGSDPRSGEKRFRAVSATQDKVYQRAKQSCAGIAGTTLEFRIAPMISALLPSGTMSDGASVAPLTLPEVLSSLSSDFATSLRSLSLILEDIKRLASLGSLPISLKHMPDGPVLAVRFAGSDGETVSHLCDEVGITRGIVHEDAGWKHDKEVEMALLFPFAPTKNTNAWDHESLEGYFDRPLLPQTKNPISSSNASILSSLHDQHDDETSHPLTIPSTTRSGTESLDMSTEWAPRQSLHDTRELTNEAEYEGVEGIYKFLQVCDDSRRA